MRRGGDDLKGIPETTTRGSSALDRVYLVAFLTVAAGVVLIGKHYATVLGSIEHGMVLAFAISIDLTVTVPLAFYFLVIRPRGLPNAWLAPVCAACLAAAYLILPAGFESPLSYLELAAVPLELGFVAYLVWRFRVMMRSEEPAASPDALARLKRVCTEMTGSKRVGDLAAGEAAMFWFLVRPPKDAPSAAERFSHHRRSGHVSLVVVLLFLFAVEGTVIHYLLQMWNVYAAWIVTASTIYAALWLIADLRAAVARPVLVGRDRLLVRAGFRFDAEIPSSSIQEIVNARPFQSSRPVATTFFGEPSHWVLLRKEIEGEGPYGFARKADAIGLTPDNPSEFERAVRELIENGK